MILKAEVLRKNNECPESPDKISKADNITDRFIRLHSWL